MGWSANLYGRFCQLVWVGLCRVKLRLVGKEMSVRVTFCGPDSPAIRPVLFSGDFLLFVLYGGKDVKF